MAGVSAAVTVNDMDVMAELSGTFDLHKECCVSPSCLHDSLRQAMG